MKSNLFQKIELTLVDLTILNQLERNNSNFIWEMDHIF